MEKPEDTVKACERQCSGLYNCHNQRTQQLQLPSLAHMRQIMLIVMEMEGTHASYCSTIGY